MQRDGMIGEGDVVVVYLHLPRPPTLLRLDRCGVVFALHLSKKGIESAV
jgi:hypothetical protein